jgi:hypothetical protein
LISERSRQLTVHQPLESGAFPAQCGHLAQGPEDGAVAELGAEAEAGEDFQRNHLNNWWKKY